MARPANTPRLAQIDPVKLADQVTQRVLDHMINLHMAMLDPFLANPLRLPEPSETEIYRVVLELTRYARGGYQLDAPAQEYLISLIGLWSGPLVNSSDVGPLGLDTELGVVVYAAEGREAMEDGHALTAPQLAALGGMAKRAVAGLCASGEIDAYDRDGEWRIEAAEATRWLATRAGSA